MNENEISFNLILHAGNAKSNAMRAILSANEYNFEEAQQHLKEAKEELKIAHQVQTDMLSFEAKGNQLNLNILLVHSQDHLSMAMMSIENANQIILMMKRIQQLELKMEG